MLLPILILLVTIITAAGFITQRWWFPAPINEYASWFDSYFAINLILTGAIFIAAQLAFVWAILRFRNRGNPVRYSHGNNRLEIFWTIATLVLFVGAAFAGSRLWSDVHLSATPANALRVEVQGKQFAWNFRYAGVDGKFGRTKVQLINDAAGNPFGIDEADPAGNDDIMSSELRVPAGRPIELKMGSPDVLHNFFVRELRIKQDLVPGMEIPLRFRADKPGAYEIACSELCGLGHHQMRSVLVVLPPETFETWLKDKAAEK